MSNLSPDTLDKHGKPAPVNDLYKEVVHTGNGKTYTIVGFAWNGATDEWNHVYVAPGGVMVVRPVQHLTGLRSNGTPRYIHPVATPDESATDQSNGRFTTTLAEYLKQESNMFEGLKQRHDNHVGSVDSFVSKLLGSHSELLHILAQVEERRTNGGK